MKKQVIASLVGALIIFTWQFLSNAALDLHRPAQQYTAKQDSIIQFLGNQLEEGRYFIPTTAPGWSTAEQQKFMSEMNGKPWAIIDYHESFDTNDMLMNMLRGFLVNVLIVWLLVWLLTRIGNLTFLQIFLSTLAIGFISFLHVSYTTYIWYQSPGIWIDFMDTAAAWGGTGLWLGWYLNRSSSSLAD